MINPENCHINGTEKEYFEGWYFKNTNANKTICFIPGISISKGKKEAFIQVISNNNSSYFAYDYSDFSYGTNPFYARIKDNYFSLDRIKLDIQCKEIVQGEIIFSNKKEIKKSMLSPSIMGHFAYIPNMECNHGVLSLYHNEKGIINYNGEEIYLENGIRIY